MPPGAVRCALLLLAAINGAAGTATEARARERGGEAVDFDDNRTVATASSATVEDSFDAMDTDKDGSLSAKEMKLGYQQTPARRLISAVGEDVLPALGGVTVFMHADKDSDLIVDRSEWQHWCNEAVAHVDRLQHTWKMMDKNRDGVVWLREFKAAHSKDLSEGEEEAEFKAISEGADKFDRKQFHRHYSADDFTAADKDHDGFLSKDEMKGVLGHGSAHDGVVHAELSAEEEALDLEHSFSQYDLNKDGKVSEEEYGEHALEEAKLTAHPRDLAGDEKLEAALSGDDTYEHSQGELTEDRDPIEDEDTDTLTEAETSELLARKEDL